jgi:N-sulfoglucosamine sulfohydrolase
MKHPFTLGLLLILSTAVLADERPSILLLMAEDLSPRIGAFGDKVAVTPNIDKLAQQGVRYTNTFTAAGVCAPSRASIITGMHQESIGAQHMRAFNYKQGTYYTVPPKDMKAFPELLRAEGYFTFNSAKLDYQFSDVLPGSGPFTLWDSDTTKGINFDDIPDAQPFFGYLNFLGTHESGLFPRYAFPRNKFHLMGQLTHIKIHWDTKDQVLGADVEVPPYYPDTPVVREDIARQYNNLITVDRQVGEVLEKLEASGRADNTIVIWTTDHGDGLPRAKRELYDSGLKVPMIIRWPEKFRPADVKPGSLDERLISFVDLAPTILSLAGAPLPNFLHGRVFAGAEKLAPREYIYAARDRIGHVSDRQRAVRDKRFKYIRSYNQQTGGFHLGYRDNLNIMQELWRMLAAGELNAVQRQWFSPRPAEMLFDTQNDPHEINNLADNPDYFDELERLREAYKAQRTRVPDLSDKSEAYMAARFWPEGIEPITAIPNLQVENSILTLTCASEGASIGYRINGSRWHLYTAPIPLLISDKIEVKAVRYGWAESEITKFNF